MTYYGNRGRTFEEFITFANKRYREMGAAVVWKVPTPFLPIRNGRGEIVSCKVEEKSCVDYLGRVGDRPIAIEAKHIKGDSIRWDAVQEHQSDFLTDFCAKDDGISLVVVSFGLGRFYAVPWQAWKLGRDAWQEAQRKGQRKAEIKEIIACVDDNGKDVVWSTNGKASVKENELLDEWEVTMGGKYGLDYLRRYI